jgi:hypothetical protein
MTLRVTWPQALAWRLGRQLLDPIGGLDAEGVVRQLGGVQAQVGSTAELGVRMRQVRSSPREVAEALAGGRLMKTWAMRGTLHLLVPDQAGAFLSLMAAGRSWERPSWQRYFGMTNHTWTLLRDAVRELLAGGVVLTREELVEGIVMRPGLEHVGEELRSGWGTLLKPLAWQGDLCHGPSRGTRVTFMAPENLGPGWAGVPEADDAAPVAITTYLRAYGPATVDQFGNWISRGRVSKRDLRAWFGAVADRLAEVDVEGTPMFVMADDADELVAMRPARSVRLVPGFDAWVLGPGTEDERIIAPGRRREVSRQSGWIAPVVIRDGVVSGTWSLDDSRLSIAWFAECGTPPRRPLDAEVGRLASILGRPLDVEVVSTERT